MVILADSLLLLLDCLGNLLIEVLLLLINHNLEVLEHLVHLLRELSYVLVRLRLSFLKLLLIILDIFLEVIDFLDAPSDHIFLRLIGIESHGIYTKHLSKVLHLSFGQTLLWAFAASGLGLLLLQEFWNALFAKRSFKIIDDWLREMNLTQVSKNL